MKTGVISLKSFENELMAFQESVAGYHERPVQVNIHPGQFLGQRLVKGQPHLIMLCTMTAKLSSQLLFPDVLPITEPRDELSKLKQENVNVVIFCCHLGILEEDRFT